ncbi:hypothetical protein HNQ92_001725 [Rhabdobacter roseus]|uniref:Uncharacterized protein n=1 Tax=Rhabdobacter roseus TaxID=1655419 RepID=A0A840TVA4_9BACT|nr:hypothetical protein [Rhabdobacter roseus]MBB5283599.1 hypothetical protein [Rhabdobacter roseus]
MSIRLPGVPKENISIDQKKNLIRAKVPERLPAVAPLDQHHNAYVLGNGLVGMINWATLFTEDSLHYRQIELKEIGPSTQTQPPKVAVTYQVEFIPQGPLQIDAERLASMSPSEVGSWVLTIPFKNLYANALPVQTRFTNRETKEVSVYNTASPNLIDDGNPYVRMLSRSWGSSDDQLNLLIVNILTFGAKVTPGTYDIEFVTQDGSVLAVPRPITFPLNIVRLNGWEVEEVPRLRPGETYVLTGRNLFANDISITVLDTNDQVVEVPEVEFDPYGTEIDLKLPPTIPPGHYVIRIVSNATRANYCRQIQVTSRPLAPLEISRVSPASLDCSIREPLVLKRTVFTQLLVGGTAARVRLKLVAVQDSTRVHFVRTDPPRLSEDQTTFTLRTLIDIPAGRYYGAVQAVDDFGNMTQEGPLYWRVLEVR